MAGPVVPTSTPADGAAQDAFVEDAPELGRTRSVQNCLARETGCYLLV
jgi:hypothetical protein